MEDIVDGRPLVRKPEQTLSAVMLLGILGLTATFVAGVLMGSSGVRPLPAEKVVSQAPLSTVDLKLHTEARGYLAFWQNRESRMDGAAKRLGWKKADLAKAMRLIDAAKPRFEAVAAALGATDDTALTQEMDLLFEQLALTYCAEFRLVCIRGVPPDQARPKKTVRKPAGKSRRASFYLDWRSYANHL